MKDSENDNVVFWCGQTRLDIPADRVLKAALEDESFDNVTVLGWIENEEGEKEYYLASSCGKAKDILWDLEQAKKIILG